MPNIDGVGPDAPIETHENGAQRTHSPYRFDLLPPLAMAELAKVLDIGARKYAVDNWRGLPIEGFINHALGHIFAWTAKDTQEGDPSTHLYHAMTNLVMASELVAVKLAQEKLDLEAKKLAEENAKFDAVEWARKQYGSRSGKLNEKDLLFAERYGSKAQANLEKTVEPTDYSEQGQVYHFTDKNAEPPLKNMGVKWNVSQTPKTLQPNDNRSAMDWANEFTRAFPTGVGSPSAGKLIGWFEGMLSYVPNPNYKPNRDGSDQIRWYDQQALNVKNEILGIQQDGCPNLHYAIIVYRAVHGA